MPDLANLGTIGSPQASKEEFTEAVVESQSLG